MVKKKGEKIIINRSKRIRNAEREVIEDVMVLSDARSLNSQCLQLEKKRFEGLLQMLLVKILCMFL